MYAREVPHDIYLGMQGQDVIGSPPIRSSEKERDCEDRQDDPVLYKTVLDSPQHSKSTEANTTRQPRQALKIKDRTVGKHGERLSPRPTMVRLSRPRQPASEIIVHH